MKKSLALGLLVSLFLVSAGLLPALAVEGTATIKASDLYSLANRKSYRLGVRGSIISPTRDVLVTKDSSFDFGLEFDAKLNENLDTGPRFGYSSFKNNQGAAVNATYAIMRFGYGARVYALYWGDYGSTHGFANLYFVAEANYYTANKGNAVVAASPSSYAGLGGQVGAGLEFAFGPSTGAFVEADILKTSVKDSLGTSLPLDGYILAAGARMSFF
jgi:hypothetical protein